MQRNECKPGTQVIIRGTVIRNNEPGCRPICVELPKDGEALLFAPDEVEPAQPKYDPARKFRKGDKARFIHRGRRSYVLVPEPGEELTILEEERQEQVLVRCSGYTASFHFADLVLVKPVEEIDVEECCCNPATESAPTVEMIKEACNRLENLMRQCNTPVLLCMLIEEKDGNIEHRVSANDSVSKMAGKDGIGWTAARGFLYASRTCFSGDPESISQGIKHALEFLDRKKQGGVFAAIIDTPFDH